MNVTDLARQLRINTKLLLEILPGYGYDIGKKAIKIDDRTAAQITRQWKFIKRDLEKKQQQEMEEKKQKERELRKESGKTVVIPPIITVRDFAERLDLSVTELMKELMKNGILANQNQNIDYETAAILAEDLGFFVSRAEEEKKHALDEEKELARTTALSAALEQAEQKRPRPPVIVVMGHVDHGKTSLLDTIRKANITATESGGITQHIGAYQTVWKDPKTGNERSITFIDTPGHEAFTVMRSRGAKVADIAILIVAADDGVKPQTEEVIQIIKAAKIPFVVAINKIDKENADIQRTKTELSNHGVQPEEWGGAVPMVEISAKQNLHVDKLLDMLLLVADINAEAIQADPDMPAVGTIIESHKDKHMGPVATILVQSGTLRAGNELVVNDEIYGKVRGMRDYRGANITAAPPSTPVQIIGFKAAPQVGDILDVAKAAQSQKIDVKAKQTEQTGAERRVAFSSHAHDDHDGEKKTLNLIVKSDVLGSLEAIVGSLDRFKHDEVAVRIVGKGLGNITESDVQNAESSHAVLVGFRVMPTATAAASIREKELRFERFDVIYGMIDWIKDELEKLLDQEKIITDIGTVKILAIFRTDKKAMTVGGRVETGKLAAGAKVRVKRNEEIVGDGVIATLQIGQREVKEVSEGFECGMRYEGKTKIEAGDVFEAYTEERKAKKIEFIKPKS